MKAREYLIVATACFGFCFLGMCIVKHFRQIEQKAISTMHFNDFVRYRDKADSLQRKLDSCMSHELHTHRMINEIKSTGKIHSQGSCKMMVR